MGLASLTTMSKGEVSDVSWFSDFLKSDWIWNAVIVCYAIEHCTLTIKSIQDLHSKGLRLCGRNSTIHLMYFLVATNHCQYLDIFNRYSKKKFQDGLNKKSADSQSSVKSNLHTKEQLGSQITNWAILSNARILHKNPQKKSKYAESIKQTKYE